MLIIVGMLIGFVLVITIAASLTPSIWVPLLAKMLENDPNKPKKFAATTKIGPNKAKFKMQGGKVVALLMNKPGYKQAGGPIVPQSFEIVPLTPGETPPEEEMGIVDEFFFRHSGYRFFNPFSQRIYVYEFPRTEEVMGSDGLLKVVGKTDWSDYFLLTEQTYSFSIINADTGGGENVKATLEGQVTFEIFNPFQAAFADKKWHQQSIAAIQVRGRNFARARDFETLLGEVGKECDELKDTIGLDLAKVSQRIENGPGTEELFGVRIPRVLIRTIDMTDTEAEKSRTATYNATRQAQVVGIAADAESGRIKKIRGAQASAEAEYIETVARATIAQGALGLKMLEQQRDIAMAKEAGTLIMNSGGAGKEIDPLQAAILEQLQQANAAGSSAPHSSSPRKIVTK